MQPDTTPAPIGADAVDGLMQDIQSYASAWSLVGGRFDSGDGLRCAEALKAELRNKLVTALASAAQPTGEPVAYLWQHSETGRTRVVMPDAVITADATWRVVGPLVLAAAPKAAPAPAAVAPASEASEGWRNKFAEAVYADLEAADNQDVPLEAYPARILKVLDSIVGPRHPTVIHWRNDAIQACIAIAYKYCRDPESFQYLKQDLQALIFAAPKAAPAAQGGAEDALEEAFRAIAGIGVVGKVDGWDVIRRDSALDLLNRRIAAARAAKEGGA